MNYYQHHLGDYSKDTAHLSLLEDGAYRRMLDVYYGSEKPLPLDRAKLYRLVRVKSLAEKQAVDVILGEFFTESPQGWRNARADAEIERAQEETEENQARRENEKERQRRHRDRRKNLFAGLREHGVTPPWDATTDELQNALEKCTSQSSNGPVTRDVTAIHKPITNNQEPIKRVERQRSQGSRLPAEWQPSDLLKAWAEKERPDLRFESAVASFRDYWIGVPGSRGVKLDWDATFRNWIRKERAGVARAEPNYDAVIKRIEAEDAARAAG